MGKNRCMELTINLHMSQENDGRRRSRFHTIVRNDLTVGLSDSSF